MPKDLHNWVKAEAERHGRSMNNFIIHFLKTGMEAETKDTQK